MKALVALAALALATVTQAAPSEQADPAIARALLERHLPDIEASSDAPDAAPPLAKSPVMMPAGFPGVVAVSSASDGVIQSNGKLPNAPPPNAIWRWASVTKQVVAVLVMQEVEKGRIDLDAPATKYLPKVALPGGDTVTVRRLLNHTSGLFDPEDGPKNAAGVPLTYLRSSPKPAPGLDPQCLKPSGRAVGEGFRYNNCDYLVLDALLEAVTGKPFAMLVAERIAEPLGLKSLRVLQPGEKDDIVAVDDKGATDTDIDPGRYGAAANLAGTAVDLLTFDRALIDGKLLGKAATAEMWQGDPKAGYAALGVWSYPVKLKGCTTPQHVVERRGQVGNVQVRNLIAPERGIAVVAFAASSVPDFGEPWQGKGLTYELLSAALCPSA
ncbi:beta-lactamase family protein [Sphingosinicellaceae bacterium]|nr:beta-lactamase family protein [Sphingosinicellaceae bacterium]